MHTPDQARELWCPMVRIARHEVTEQRQLAGSNGLELVSQQHHIVAGVNHDALGGSKRLAADHQPLASCRCIAEKCGMWRWVTVRDPSAPERSNSVMCDKPVPMVRNGTGYCGLSGRPEVQS